MNVAALEVVKEKLTTFTLTDYFTTLHRILNTVDLHSLRPLNIFVLRSYTAETVQPILQLRLILEGYNPTFFWGDFNQFVQEIFDESSRLYSCAPDLILWLIRIEELLPRFIDNYGVISADVWSKEFKNLGDQFANLIDVLSKKTSAQILLQNLDTTLPYWGIYDAQNSFGQKSFVQEFNRELSSIVANYPNIFIWDFAEFAAVEGKSNLYDAKQLYTTANPFKQTAYILIANDLMRYVVSIFGKIKKCIVLDLDNTLWGGVIGEDGMEGIALGHDYPGNCYVALQKELLKLYNRGIILAINSKNNESDAFAAIDEHPYMVLKRQHFAAYQINWNDKASNLKMLAQELNIGLDSMIFIDDNVVECELVKQHIPDCTVIQVPQEPYLIPKIVLTMPYIENIRLTKEDKEKGVMYQAQVARKKLQRTTTDLVAFLNSLDMQIEIKAANKFSIPRISQLTQKTNQLNMTTRRYTEADILAFGNSSEVKVFSIAVKDRFGDNGIVGVLILRFFAQRCIIDSFLLSCRVVERTIEQSMLAFAAEYAQKNGATTMVGEFFPSAKNVLAQDIYIKLGMTKIDENTFTVNLAEKTLAYSPHIKLIS